jgi:flagella basal body P-ring formation protein FlgA
MFARKSALACVLMLPVCANAQAVPAQAMQNLSQIDSLVAATMGAEIGEPGGARAQVDRRLKLKACPVDLEVTGPDMGAAAVRCPSLGWRIRVPLDLTEAPAQAAAVRSAAPRGTGTALGQEAVKRGEPILLTVDRPTFSLSRVMIADKDGRVGEVIPVRDDPKGRPIFVRIVEPGRATILSN